MKIEAPISIVAVTDNHYMILLAALLKSIELNHKTGEPLHFYIVADNVSRKNRQKLLDSFSNPLIQFSWINIEEAISKDVRLPLDKSTYPLNIYARLFIPYFMPHEVEKCIYLDVDMIVLEEISKLWYMPLDGFLAAGVQEPDKSPVSSGNGGIDNFAELGLPGETMYYNSGLMVINNRLWREQKVPEQVLACIEKNKKYAALPDQYGLNVVLANKWKPLEPRWNTFANTEEPFPYLIHFVYIKPMYINYNYNPNYQKLFFYYVNETCWKGVKPISKSGRYLKKVGNVLTKLRSRIAL